MKSRPHEGATGMATDAHPFAMSPLNGNDQEVIVELGAAVERALAMADALELSLVGIDLCSALERIKSMEPTVNPKEMHDRD